jgi:hypothetical protein
MTYENGRCDRGTLVAQRREDERSDDERRIGNAADCNMPLIRRFHDL